MWYNKEKGFLYFFTGPLTFVNNNQRPKNFRYKNSHTTGENKSRWAISENSLNLAPELLTYWHEE